VSKGRKKRREWPAEFRKPLQWKGPIGLPPLNDVLGLEHDAETIRSFHEEYEREENRIFKEKLRRLDLLAEHYGIEHGDNYYLRLLLRFAEDQHPAFQIQDRRPPPRKRPLEQLIADVEAVKREKGCGDLEACRILFQRYKKQYPKGAMSIEKAARSRNSRLVEARNQTFVGKLLKRIDVQKHEFIIDSIISQYATDAYARAQAKARTEAKLAALSGAKESKE
jgi:hypothetical protein